MLEPELVEVVEGRAEVRQLIKVGRQVIAGSYVTDGRIVRNGGARLWRGGKVIVTDKIDSLRRFKDDVREVQTGFECGIGLADYDRHPRGRRDRVLHDPNGQPLGRPERAPPIGDDGRSTTAGPIGSMSCCARRSAAILARDVQDPRIGFVTVTDVETAPDLSTARVWVSVIGQPDERDHDDARARARDAVRSSRAGLANPASPHPGAPRPRRRHGGARARASFGSSPSSSPAARARPTPRRSGSRSRRRPARHPRCRGGGERRIAPPWPPAHGRGAGDAHAAKRPGRGGDRNRPRGRT